MKICLNCNKETTNPKFCNRSCAAIYNNKNCQNTISARRTKTKQCKNCSKLIFSSRDFCSNLCVHAYNREINPPNTSYENIKNFRKRRNEELVKYKGSVCYKCGYYKSLSALSFHHINPENKSFEISKNLHKSLNVLKFEADKCILVCERCHREIHFKDSTKSFRRKNKLKSLEYKGTKCSICSYDSCIRALDFHHLNPNEKEYSISGIMNHRWSFIKKELDKCVLVCANCHREIHDKLCII